MSACRLRGDYRATKHLVAGEIDSVAFRWPRHDHTLTCLSSAPRWTAGGARGPIVRSSSQGRVGANDTAAWARLQPVFPPLLPRLRHQLTGRGETGSYTFPASGDALATPFTIHPLLGAHSRTLRRRQRYCQGERKLRPRRGYLDRDVADQLQLRDSWNQSDRQ